MQEPIALPHPALRSGWKAGVRARIALADMSEEHTRAAMSLLALSNDSGMSVSHWVAEQMFDFGQQEWDACLAAMQAAGLVDVTAENQQSVRITWKAEK